MSELRIWLGWLTEEKLLLHLPKIELRLLGQSARILVTILTELSAAPYDVELRRINGNYHRVKMHIEGVLYEIENCVFRARGSLRTVQQYERGSKVSAGRPGNNWHH
jgi:hypothetical protein